MGQLFRGRNARLSEGLRLSLLDPTIFFTLASLSTRTVRPVRVLPRAYCISPSIPKELAIMMIASVAGRSDRMSE